MATLREIETKIARLKRDIADERLEIAELRESQGHCEDKGCYAEEIEYHQKRVKDLSEELSRLIGE